MPHQDSDILRKFRLIENLKADLATSLGVVYQAMAQNRPQEEVSEALAQTVICAYVLGRRLGVDYEQFEEIVNEKIGHNITKNPEIERWFGDLSQLKKHFSSNP